MTAHVNAHTHLYSALVPFGMPAPEVAPTSFVEILERIWWRLDRALDAETLRAAAELYALEAAAHGTAVLFDHHESPGFIEGSLDVVADACASAGVRAVLCYGATERNGGREEARRGLAECRRFLMENRRPLVRGVVGLHACFTVSDETLREAGALARERRTVLHVHVAEDTADVQDAHQRGYAGLLDRLERCDALVPGSIFAHGVHLTRAEVERCHDHGIWLVQNPRSNANNGVGYPANLRWSPRVALGTDGFPADMEAEERVLFQEAERAGDDLLRAGGRLSGGPALAASFFGPEVSILGPPAPTAELLQEARERARTAAGKLWTRMARP